MVQAPGREEPVSPTNHRARKDPRRLKGPSLLRGDAIQSLESGGESLFGGGSPKVATGKATGVTGRARSDRKIRGEPRAAIHPGGRGWRLCRNRQRAGWIYDASRLREVQRTV